MTDETVREAVGVFDDEARLRAAADELLIAGFDRSHLSLLAGQHTVEQKLGHAYERVAEFEDDPETPRLAYIGSDSRTEAEAGVIGGLAYVGAIAAVGAIVASGGTVAAALAAAAAAGGAGGLIGAALARYIDRHHAHYLQEQLDHGGLLLWVRTADAGHEERARDILSRHSAKDVHVHDLPVVEHGTKGGVSYDLSFMKTLGM
jgi:outer membrane lipoprotein SlyB